MVNSLCDLVHKYSPGFLFLSEIKSSAVDIRKIQGKMQFDHSESVDVVGKAGGLPYSGIKVFR